MPAPLPPGNGAPLRVAVARDPAGLGVAPAVAAALDQAARALGATGHLVEEAEPPGVLEAAQGWGQLIAADIEQLTRVLV